MKMGAKKYEFKSLDKDKMLVCPSCLELLRQHDIESYSNCPYCDHKFELDQEIEDFLMQPIIDSWVRKETQQPFMENNIIRVVIG